MEPNLLPQKPGTDAQKQTSQKPKIDDEYAATLARVTALQYDMEQKSKPEVKHFISKKVLIYTVISLIVSIIGMIIANQVLGGNKSAGPSEDTVKGLLDTTREVRDIENQ